MTAVEIVPGQPGAVDRIVEMHRLYYAAAWGFGPGFADEVATEMAEFLGRFDPARDGFWTALVDGRVVGAVSIDGTGATGATGVPDAEARLRWFIVDPACHGGGIGRALLDRAVAFCRAAGHRRVELWTFAGLDAARHLYEAAGFRLIEEKESDPWGFKVRFQVFRADF